MKKNRILCGILALLLAVSLIPPASAAGTPTVSISSGTVKAGESVTLTVSIKDNPGLAALRLYLYYDTGVFELDLDEGIELEGAFKTRSSYMANTIANAKENGLYQGTPGKDGVIFFWYSTAGKDTRGDGNVMKLTFKAKAAVVNGDYRIELGCGAKDATNEKEEFVSVRTSGGMVTVTGGASGGSQQPEDKPTPTFIDVDGHWAYDYIEGAAQLGIMEGYQNLFRPNDSLTRCEFVTALWRAMGQPKANRPSTFTDLNQVWYMDAVAWAQENGIIQGTGGTKFEPYWPISREQVVTILHRLAGSPVGMELMLTGTYDKLFKDSGEIHSWAKSGVYWAVFQEIYCGTHSVNVGTTLAPTADATRAHIAVMIVQYLNDQGGV